MEKVNGGGVHTVGTESCYDTPEAVVFTFQDRLNLFVRVDKLMKRTKILSYEAQLDESTGKYGARYYCQDNGGKREWYWDYELSFTIL